MGTPVQVKVILHHGCLVASLPKLGLPHFSGQLVVTLLIRSHTQRDYDNLVESGVSGDYKRFRCTQTTLLEQPLATDTQHPAHILL